jgi:hypothetical protein
VSANKWIVERVQWRKIGGYNDERVNYSDRMREVGGVGRWNICSG